MNGEAVSDCQPICNPMAWLVLPFGCMSSILAESECPIITQLQQRCTEQDEYCSVGYNVLPATGASLVVSKFWSRSVTQPFQVLWSSGVQVLLCDRQLLCL